jgi:polysaccharide deacetylase family protein (PEP-CTERM system associated)
MCVAIAARMLAHHFTVDVEEYFQVTAFEGIAAPRSWGGLESRVVHSVDRLLDMLARHEARGTFFVVGWVAERHPQLVRSLAQAGHEVAAHGWDHVRLAGQEPLEFRDSVRRIKYALEDLTGTPVLGFRAPSFSITRGREWALDVLIEEGYRYDSSLFPVRRRGYGYRGGRRDPYWLARPSGRLLEVPPLTLRWCGVNLPAAGGAYLRFFPAHLVRAALHQAERRGAPGTIYLHPWEIDPGQPRLPAPWLTRVRHYTGLRRTAAKVERLLSEFRFTAISGSALAAARADR